MDEADVSALFARVAPELPVWERSVRAADPTLADPEVIERALRYALAELRVEVARETFASLRARAERASADAPATVAASAEAHRARADARAAAAGETRTPPPAGGVRAFRAADGGHWSVHEVAVADAPWARGPCCLLFQAEGAIRRVWRYPADWRTLPDGALEALSWRH